MAANRLAFLGVVNSATPPYAVAATTGHKTNADNKMQADDSSCSHYAAEVLGESEKQVSLALGNFGALGVMDALCAVISARVQGI